MTWNETIENFSHFLKFERNFSDNTLDAYIRDVKKLKAFSEEKLDNTTPDKITFENLQEFLLYLTKEKISERTQARGISSIKSFLNILSKKKLEKTILPHFLKVQN